MFREFNYRKLRLFLITFTKKVEAQCKDVVISTSNPFTLRRIHDCSVGSRAQCCLLCGTGASIGASRVGSTAIEFPREKRPLLHPQRTLRWQIPYCSCSCMLVCCVLSLYT